jgi:hypothetical protein
MFVVYLYFHHIFLICTQNDCRWEEEFTLCNAKNTKNQFEYMDPIKVLRFPIQTNAMQTRIILNQYLIKLP